MGIDCSKIAICFGGPNSNDKNQSEEHTSSLSMKKGKNKYQSGN